MKLLLALHKSEELYSTSYCKSHAIGVLSVCDIERRGAALHFTHQEQEVHVIRSYEEGGVCKLANERLKLLELIIGEGFSPESHKIFRLWTRLNHRDRVIPAFVDTFNQNFEVFAATYSQGFRGWNDQ